MANIQVFISEYQPACAAYALYTYHKCGPPH